MAPRVRFEVNKLVLDAVVAKRLVVVAFVEVLLTAVKFWKVDEAVARMFEKVVSAENTLRPVNEFELYALAIVVDALM